MFAPTTKPNTALVNEMTEKKKIMLLCDHPLVPSGVGTQARYLIEGLLATGKYKFHVFGGAMKHPDYREQRVSPDKFGDDGWIIVPVDGYGDKERLRAALAKEKPDLLLLFTDPRQFVWVWEMEDEIRPICPIAYWHVWDNDPTPKYNKVFYDSTDLLVPLSLKTYGILQDMKHPNFKYIPHAVSAELFKPLDEVECQKFKRGRFGPHADKKFIVFWNNRNARRKMTGDVVAAFAKFAEKVGKENVALAMHTIVNDQEGQNIVEVARCFDIEKNLIISEERCPPDVLNGFYNACDITLNIANNEGFGLSTLESLMAGSPVLLQMTGGLQFQIGNWWEDLKDFTDQDKLTEIAKRAYKSKSSSFYGIPVFPASRSCTGSQPIPYIYDDRVSHEDVVKGLIQLYEMGREKRRELGKAGSVWAEKTFNMAKMISDWDSVLSEEINRSEARKTRSSLRVVGI